MPVTVGNTPSASHITPTAPPAYSPAIVSPSSQSNKMADTNSTCQSAASLYPQLRVHGLLDVDAGPTEPLTDPQLKNLHEILNKKRIRHSHRVHTDSTGMVVDWQGLSAVLVEQLQAVEAKAAEQRGNLRQELITQLQGIKEQLTTQQTGPHTEIDKLNKMMDTLCQKASEDADRMNKQFTETLKANREDPR